MSEQNIIAASLSADIAKHCAAFEQSPEYAEMINTHVRNLYEKAIEDTFRWGDFPDRVKKALESALPANIREMVDLPRYNTMLAKALATEWERSSVGENITKQMQDMVIEFVKTKEIPQFIKASDLWSAYITQYQEEAAHEGWEAPEAIMQYSDYGCFQVGLCKEPYEERQFGSRNRKEHPWQFDESLYFMKAENRIDKEWVQITHDDHPCYKLSHGKINGDELGKKIQSFRSEYEEMIAALYYGRSLLILDSDDADELCYPHNY